MASKEQLAEFNRKAKGRYVGPIPPMPKIPHDLAEGPPQERRRKIAELNKANDEWRKNLNNQPVAESTTTTVEGKQGKQGEQGIQGPAGAAGQQIINEITNIVTPPVITLGELGLTKRIFIAQRTDGRPGLGTPSDPFDGSTVDKFDAIMLNAAKVLAYSEINLLPGEFQTRGWELSRDAVSWRLRPGCKLRGRGIGVTTLKLVDATVTGTAYFAIIGSLSFNGSIDSFWNPAGGLYHDCEVSDMTIDLNFSAQPANIPTPTIGTNAIQLNGFRTKVSRVRVINFGNADNAEVFVINLGSPVVGVGEGRLQDQLIEDCIVERCVFNGDASGGVSMLAFGTQETPPGVQAWAHNSVYRNNVCDGTFTDGLVPYPTADAAYPDDRVPPIGIGLGGGYGIVIEGNTHRNGVRGPRGDTWNHKSLTIRNNQFHNVSMGVRAEFGGSSPYTANRFFLDRIIVEGNEFHMQIIDGLLTPHPPVPMSFFDAFDLNDYIFREIIVRNNTVQLVDRNMIGTNYAAFGIYVGHTENALIEDNLIRLPWASQGPHAQASILTNKVARLQARNNRRPEDNSLILPWSVDKNKFLGDYEFEQHKAAVLRMSRF